MTIGVTIEPTSLGSDCGASTLDQLGNGVAQLRALALPMTDAPQLQAQSFLAFGCEWVVETDTLDEPAIAAIARIRYHHVKKRTIFRTATGKSNNYHNETYLKLMSLAKGRGFYDILSTSCKHIKSGG